MFGVSKVFGSKPALKNISMEVCAGDFLLICGPSGAGKTTLLKLLYLDEVATDGQILVDGINISRIARRKIPYFRRTFGIVFQDYKLIATKTVYENVALVPEVMGLKPAFVRKLVNSVLRIVGMEQTAQAYPPTLSGGEQQRVAVARAIVGQPKIILADEPFGSLDPDSAAHVLKLLLAYNRKGATVLVASHDRSLAKKLSCSSLYLKNGSVWQSETSSL
jgi:cell division transport system ATP-binding protein